MVLTLNSFAQSSLTNTVTGELKIFGPSYIYGAFFNMSKSFGIRACVEINTPFIDECMTFTNATLAQVLSAVMDANPAYEWRYENQTETFYVHPKTNAVSMMRCNPVSVTNAPMKTLFKENDILDLNDDKIKLWEGVKSFKSWTDETVSLKFENACFWQILDAINTQHPDKKFWAILDKPESDFRYLIYFHDPRLEQVLIP